MRYPKLRGRIVEVFGTQYAFAKAMGFGNVTISNKLNGKTDWTIPEMKKACELLGIDPADCFDFF